MLLELFGTLVGLLYLWLEYRASIWLWLAGVVMPAIYVVVYYEAGLYADAGINIYYLLAALYGWLVWSKSSKGASEPSTRPDVVPVATSGITPFWSDVPRKIRRLFLLVLITVKLTVIIAWILIAFTDSTVPWLDALTTALSIIAMWMLARKYAEQWLVWLAVDIISSGLYLYKELYFTAALYLLYAIIAWFGYRKWCVMMRADEQQIMAGLLGNAPNGADGVLPYDAVVLADGDYPVHAFPLVLLHHSPYVACCDGAANEYLRRGYRPDIIVGDGDSLTPANRRKYAHLLHRIAEQESNDLSKTVSYLASLGHRRILILGATGKREDHTLANISLLIEYMRQGLEVRMYTDHGYFIPCRGDVTLSSRPGQQLSFFNFTATRMSAEGVCYPIRPFTSWWQGTLNEAVGESLRLAADGEYIVYVAY